MEDSTEILEKVKIAEQTPALPKKENEALLRPRLIEGIDGVGNDETMGSRGKDEGFGANAAYMGGKDGKEFVFTNYSPEELGREDDVGFMVINPDVASAMQRFIKTGLMVPTLIDAVYTRKDLPPEYDEYFKHRAMEHNLYQILTYLKRGGNIEDLPKVKMMPDMETIKQAEEAEVEPAR